MHTPLILAVVAFGLTCYTLAKVYSKQRQALKTQHEAVEYKLVGECAKIRDEIKMIEEKIVNLASEISQYRAENINMTSLLNFAITPAEVRPPKLPPANRHPRTEEQKRQASVKKTAEHAERKSLIALYGLPKTTSLKEARKVDEMEKKRAQEQVALTPQVIGESLNEPLKIPS